MNKRELKYYNMYLQTQRYLDMHTDKWTGVPAIVRHKNSLDANILSIKNKDGEQSGETKGITISKGELKDMVALKTAIVSGALYAYASDSGNTELQELSNYSTSKLIKLGDLEFAQKAEMLLNLGTTHLAAIADHGVTAEQITECTTSLDDFLNLIGRPRTVFVANSKASDEVADLVEITRKLLKDQLDRTMLQYQISDESFYNGYKKSRVIID